LVSFYVTDLDRALAAAGSLPIAEPMRRAEPPYAGRRAATLRGGDGELIELIGLEHV
jgi:hypothetical protein